MVAVVTSLLVSCTTAVPRWRVDAILMLNAVRKAGGDTRYPAEFDNAARSVERAEALTRDREIEEADRYYRMALLESEFIERKLAAERVAREIEVARRLEEERRRLDELRREEEARLAREKARAEQETLAAEQARRAAERARQQAKPLPAYHTVKRGETLPQISSLPEVYNDNMLWPLLYRANRDQIRDPRHLWPGQVLRIPRGVSREDLAEARRYAQDKPLH
jgi:nucleoid-associated protein YgaU